MVKEREETMESGVRRIPTGRRRTERKSDNNMKIGEHDRRMGAKRIHALQDDARKKRR